MRLPRVRFTMGWMSGAIAALAVLIAIGKWGYYRYAGPRFAKTYYIGDLIDVQVGSVAPPMTAKTNAKLTDEVALLRSSITPDMWWFGTSKVVPFPLSSSLVVHGILVERQSSSDG